MNREELLKKVANNIDGLFHNKHSFEDMADRLIDLIQSNTESKDEWKDKYIGLVKKYTKLIYPNDYKDQS